MNSIPFAGAVLIGGASRRMGRPKSQILVAGESLLQRQLRLLREAGATQLMVAQHPDRAEFPPLAGTVTLVTDSVPDAGPLAGLERLLASAHCDQVLVLAVDLPRLDADFLRRLVDQATSAVGVIPVVEGHLEPLAAVYPRMAHSVAEAHLSRRQLALQDLAQVGLTAGWLRPWVIPASARVFLTNWNRPEDYANASSST